MPNKDSAELRELLHDFGHEYEWPYRFILDVNRSPSDQQDEARKALVAEYLPQFAQHAQVAVEQRHLDAINELTELCMYLVPKSNAWEKCHEQINTHLKEYQNLKYGTNFEEKNKKYLEQLEQRKKEK